MPSANLFVLSGFGSNLQHKTRASHVRLWANPPYWPLRGCNLWMVPSAVHSEGGPLLLLKGKTSKRENEIKPIFPLSIPSSSAVTFGIVVLYIYFGRGGKFSKL